MSKLYSITSKYDGKCRECSRPIKEGDPCFFDPDGGKGRKIVCPECYGDGDKVAPTPDPEEEARKLLEGAKDTDPFVPGQDAQTKGLTGEYLTEYRVRLTKVAQIEGFDIAYHKAADIEPLCRHMIGDADREHLIAIAVGPDMKPVGIHTVSIGTLDQTVAAPREAFKFLVSVGAFAFVLAHNHPVPDETPSPADLSATKRMVDVGNLAGIPLLASLIIARDDRWTDILKHLEKRNHRPYDWNDDDDPDKGQDDGDDDKGQNQDGDDERQQDQEIPDPDPDGEDGNDLVAIEDLPQDVQKVVRQFLEA